MAKCPSILNSKTWQMWSSCGSASVMKWLSRHARNPRANARSWIERNALMNNPSIIGDKSKEGNNRKQAEETTAKLKTCAQCGEKIQGKFLLRALDQFWHEECLKCSYCSTQLTDLSLKFYFKRDLMLCKRDYIRWDALFSVKSNDLT